jgi:hypothetical protein
LEEDPVGENYNLLLPGTLQFQIVADT